MFLFITASENNAWLLNIRGRDTKYTPIPYSYVLVDKNRNIKFFCDLKKISPSFKKHFKNALISSFSWLLKYSGLNGLRFFVHRKNFHRRFSKAL